MIISTELADEIVQRSMAIIHHNVNVIDKNGIIIASGDRSRIGKIHNVGLAVAKSAKCICVYNNNNEDLTNSVQAGINQPIIVNGNLELVLGVSGNPNEISRYAELAFLTAELIVKQAIENEKINWTIRIKDLQLLSILKDNTELNNFTDAEIQYIESSYNLPKVPYVFQINIEHHRSDYINIIREIIKRISDVAKDIEIGIIDANTFFALASQVTNLNDTLKDIRNFCKDHMIEVKVIKSFTAYNLESLVNSIRFSLFSINKIKDYSTNISDIKNPAFVLNYLLTDNLCTDFFNYLISKIQNHSKGNELILTLKTYIQNNLEKGKTSNALGIHRNTLQNRLKVITDITSLNLNKFADLTVLYLALISTRNEILE